ncbi:hypothetical protein F66182_735 [Fusarium sp. NRRL 66182]|nr:hypothetical protein F66182_735 [Fusarium sp. NRRL 66182]
MRIAASLGVLVAAGLFGHSASQATDYGNPNGSPVGNPADGSSNTVPGNNDGVPSNLPFPGNPAGTGPGSLPSGAGPISPGAGSSGLPPNGPGGIPGSGPGNTPVNPPGNLPGNIPGAGSVVIPGSFPTNAPHNIPGAPGSVVIPGSLPTNVPQNAPGIPGAPGSGFPGPGSPGSGSPGSGSPGSGSPGVGVSGLPTCPLLSTRTVVVTVYPTDILEESGFSWPDEEPNDSESDQTTAQTPPLPTKPTAAASLTPGSVVAPFTTLTLDIWGTGRGPSSTGVDSGNGKNPGAGDGTNSGVGNNSDDGSNSDVGSNDESDSGVGNNSGTDGENGSQGGPGSPFPPASGSGAAPEYSDRASDASSVSIPGASGVNTQAPASTPFQTPGVPNNGGAPGSQPQSSLTGPDQEASNSLPVTTGPGQEASDSLPVTTGPQGQGENSPWATNNPGDNGAGQPSPSFITITGQDGLPTVVISGSTLVPGQGENSPWATAVPGENGAVQPSSFITITGQDGLPTVISSGSTLAPGQQQPPVTLGFPQGGNSQGLPGGIPSGVPFPSVSTGIPGTSGPQGPFNTPTVPLPGEPTAGITTCTTLTITGTDGLPTVVESTWVIPFSTPVTEGSSQLPVTGAPQGTLSGIPIDVGSIPTGPVDAPGSPQDGSGSLATTCTSYTIIGTDGLPTVVHSTWAVPAATPGSGDSSGLPESLPSGDLTTGLSTFGPSGVSSIIPTLSGLDNTVPITTCTTYTVIGADGLPSVFDSTFVIPAPANTGDAISDGPDAPSEASDALPNGRTSPVTTQASGAPGSSSSGPADATASGIIGSGDITTCTKYTTTGFDGLPTVVDSTYVIPGSINTQFTQPGNPSFVSDSLPSGLPTGIPGQLTAFPTLPSEDEYRSALSKAAGITTCITYTVMGPDGLPTVVDSTFVIHSGIGAPTETGPSQTASSVDSAGTFTTLTTAVILGPDGKPTSTVQTVIFSDSSALGISASLPQGTASGIAFPTGSGPVFTAGDMNPLSTGIPSLNDYDIGSSDESVSAIVTDSRADEQNTLVTGTTTGTATWTITTVVNPTGGPMFSSGAAQPPHNPSDNDASDQLPQTAYGPIPSESTLWPLSAGSGILQTSTWTNIIKAETTSYTINYPLTTLATIAVPVKRHARRQEMSAWSNTTSSEIFTQNTSLGASLSSALSTSDATTSSSMALSLTSTTLESPSATSSQSGSSSICATGGSIGNTTIDFDNSKPGPLFNPVENIWFSGGFLIAPPTSQQPQPYVPSSGGQLVEFVPPALSNTTTTISGDVAQIGVGPHSASPCFRFDFFGASLGCDAQGSEKWCEFEISAYRWNETSLSEESIAWSETKQVPACPTFSEGGYELTHIDLDGYTDLSSVLITLRVTQDLRVWWGDDFRVGWTDNSCVAASCRTSTPSQLVKRETVISALRQGVYQWTPHELKRVEDSLV